MSHSGSLHDQSAVDEHTLYWQQQSLNGANRFMESRCIKYVINRLNVSSRWLIQEQETDAIISIVLLLDKVLLQPESALFNTSLNTVY